jgi:hypothetical protein
VSNPEEYRQQAAKCILVAEDCDNSTSRISLMQMAQAWLRLAEHAEKNSPVRLVYETPEEQTRRSA